MIAIAPLVHCRFCGAQMDVQWQPGWRSAGHGHWLCTCWEKPCPLFSMTSTADVYSTLDLLPYGVAPFESLQDGDVFRHADGGETAVIYNDGAALWLQDSDSDFVYEQPFDALTEGDYVQFVGRRFCTVAWAKQWIECRAWRQIGA